MLHTIEINFITKQVFLKIGNGDINEDIQKFTCYLLIMLF